MAWGRPDEVFDRLAGPWALERTIEPLGAAMSGTASFIREGELLLYREEGVTHLANGQSLKGHRAYRFRRLGDGLAVYFDESPSRLFHRIHLEESGTSLAGQARHDCAPDTYLSHYEFRPDGSFAIRHEVSGPRKAYTSASLYKRLSSPPPSSG